MLKKNFVVICLALLPFTLGCSVEKTEEGEAASTAEEETTTTTDEDGTATTTTTASDGTTTTSVTKPDGTKITKVKKPDGTTTTTTVASNGTTTTTSTTGDTATTTATDGSTSTSCALTENTTATSTTNAYGCSLLTRDTSTCQATRTSQGLSGYWLKFSCRVTLTKSGSTVEISTDSRPDYLTPYFGSTNVCYTALSASANAAGRRKNPLSIASQSIAAMVPFAPTTAASASATGLGLIGVAANGVSIFNNAAAPGDDIYSEVSSFDQCEGHPNSASSYHYHIEPASISYTDSAFIGVMRDGFPIYGRKDADGTTPTLDSAGGHTGTTVDSPSTAVYHYHVNMQTNGTDSAYFISTGYYKGTKGTCTGC
ncbi:MAG TPA: YHYH protein [Oligoflexus sp.]|uniref:YHYH protein n=1 Tax=Oligoflexus sp. TaxID=1971216 RepID=UPI002D46FADC|nr:YHYH protein [Oligoflexus sp.]HYX34280.1 YHYH protein [Oligoflexus sp.]